MGVYVQADFGYLTQVRLQMTRLTPQVRILF